ncbi:MAG: amino acid ABC transporter permease [Acutalibacteraceae bacterium]
MEQLLTNIKADFAKLKADFILNFIEADRWKLLLKGLKTTIIITIFAVILGVIIGLIVAIIRATYDKNYDKMRGFGKSVCAVLNFISKIYLTVIRGTPVVLQLLIMYYIIFASSDRAVLIAILSFGINSGAYVAEIFRGGIMSIDEGQFEAGRSLGFNFVQTMRYIVVPQAFKNVLPALLNEFIALVKETSVSGYVTLVDLTRAGDIIRGDTFSSFMPLIAVAMIYLAIVMLLTWLLGKLERRLRTSDR